MITPALYSWARRAIGYCGLVAECAGLNASVLGGVAELSIEEKQRSTASVRWLSSMSGQARKGQYMHLVLHTR
jgi:hypothetical protein